MSNRITRPNWYSFQKATTNDLDAEQASYLGQIAGTNESALGNGVRLEFPEEPTIFDSASLTVEQSGYVGTDTFDGRGILASPYMSTDLDEGNQIAVEVSGAKLDGALSMFVTIIGKTFDNSLTYEHLTFTNNGFQITHNSYKEITNVLFQNFLGNSNTSVDGYGSFNVGGRVRITEASSMRVSLDLIGDEQVLKPDIIFRDYKVYDSGKMLDTVINEAIGANNDIDDLDINTTVAKTRTFSAGGTTDIIYGQKFKMSGDNIQKVTVLLALTSGSTWSGSLVLEIRPLQTTTNCPTDFLPESEIEFDPDTVPLESIAFDQSDLEDRGVVLNSIPQPVDFVFTGTNISKPSLSNLVDGQYYVLTIRRTGSTATGTISLEEATNSSSDRFLTVYQSGQWTDVTDSTLWYQVWTDSVKVANGTVIDQGTVLVMPKTVVDNNGVTIQAETENLQLADTSEGTENYVVVRKGLEFSDVESHPTTGDLVFSKKADVPEFAIYEQADVLTLLTAESELNVLARVKDNNSRSNPTITGNLDYPGLALNNTIDIVNPGSDLLVQNVVGSTIIPNTAKPTLKYRIVSQEIITDLYGDVDLDGEVSIDDSNRINDLDGYAPDLSSGTIAPADQLASLLAGEITVHEILRADVNGDGYVDSQDFAEVSAFILNGTAMTAGSSFTRVRLKVEPIVNPELYLDSDGNSLLSLESIDPDLIDNVTFSAIPYQISYIPTWDAQHINLVDLRRYSHTSFLEFSSSDLQSDPESGGKNSLFVAGDLYINDTIRELDGSPHPLDYERNVIEIELPEGDTEGRLNIFDHYIVGKMMFSDGSFVSSSAINDNQIRFEVSIGSHVKNLANAALDETGLGYADGYGVDFDGYNDGYGSNADEAIGAYMEHSSGILRIRAFNIVRNELFPELRTRILVTVSLKKAGFKSEEVYVDTTSLAQLIEPIT